MGNKPKGLTGLSQKGTGGGHAVSHVRHRGPQTSRPTAGTYPDRLLKRNVVTPYISRWESAPQGEPIGVRAGEVGRSEGRPVIGWIGESYPGTNVR
jgi:hypothetical protein